MLKATGVRPGLVLGLLFLAVSASTHNSVVYGVIPDTAISAPSAAATSAGPITYTVTYTNATTIDLRDQDITLNKTGTADGTVAVTDGTTATPTVTISSITGDGTLGITVAAGRADDGGGLLDAGAGPSATFAVDNTAPTVSIAAPSAASTSTGPITYAVTYTNATTINLRDQDITLNKTGTADGTVAVTNGTTATPTVTISSITGDGTLGITVAAGRASDAASNVDLGDGPSATFDVDSAVPTVSIGDPSATSTSTGPITYTVTYIGATSISLVDGNVTLNKTGTANGTVAVTNGTTATPTVTISSITGTGTLGISIAAATASNGAGTALAAGPSATFSVASAVPTVAISAPSAAAASTGPITYTITYTEATAVTLASGNVTLNKTGTANGTVAVTGAGTTTRTVTISSITGSGTLGITLAAATASNGAGPSLAAGPSTTFAVDNTAPTLAISAPSKTATTAGPVTYTVTYTGASAVTLDESDITLNKTGTADATVTVTGSGTTTRTVTISDITGDGTLGISLASGTAADAAGNTSLAGGPSTTFSVDNTKPAISIGAPSATTTVSGPVTYTITYTGASAVTLAAANITLNKTGTANGTVAVTGSGTATRTVTISAISGQGKLGISIAAETASDAAGNLALAAGPSTTFDTTNTNPALGISAPSATNTTVGPVTYTVTYTGATAVTLAAANVTLNKTGTANGTVIVTGSGTSTRTVTISAITGVGTLGISIAAATASNVALAKAPAAGPSATFSANLAAPTVTISAPSAAVTSTGPVTYTITYLGASAITLAASDVTLNKTGSADGIVTVTGNSATTRTVTISGITGTGTLGISLAGATATDAGNHDAAAAGPSATFKANAGPLTAISAPSATTTVTGPVAYTVSYPTATAISLASNNVTLNKTGTATGTVAVSGTAAKTRTVTISAIKGVGTLGISVASGTATDAAGNPALAAGPSTTFKTTNTAPAIAISAPSVTTTNAGPVTYTVSYSGVTAVTLANGNITLHKTGTADGTVAVSGTGVATRTVTIAGITGTGTLGISIAAGTAANAASVTVGAAGPSAVVSVSSAPTIAISAPSATLTNTGPVAYTITYTNAADVTLVDGDVTLNKTGTANGTVAVTGAGTSTRTVTISGITGTGTLGISLTSGTATDAATHQAAAAGPSTTFDVHAGPLVSISAPSAGTTVSGPITYTVTYADATSVTLASNDITLNKTGTANGTVAVSGAGTTTRTVTISSITGVGTLGISIAAGTASDGASNTALSAGPSTTFNTTNTAPAIGVSAPSAKSTVTSAVTYTVSYTNATTVTLAAANITLNKTGTATGTVTVSGTGTTTRTVTISGISGHGTLGISIASGTAANVAQVKAGASGPSATFNVDLSLPFVMISAPSATVTNTRSVTYTITYLAATAVSLDELDITLNKTGTANGTVAVTGSGTTTRTVTISNCTGAGTLGISIGAITAINAAGGVALAAGPSATFTVRPGPLVSISAPSASTTVTGPISYTVTYLDATSVTLAANQVTLNKTGTASGTVSVSGTGASTRTVTITSVKGIGTLGISIGAGTASDGASNTTLAAGPSATFATTNSIPAIAISAPSLTDTVKGPVTYTVSYSGVTAITLAPAKVTLNKTGTANGIVTVSGSGTSTRTVTISGITGNGTLGISIASSTATNASAVKAPAAGPSATFNVNLTVPFVTISAPSVKIDNTGPVTYTVTYHGATAVTLAAGNVTLNKTGTANGTVAVSGSGTSTRTVTLSGLTGEGTLGISIAAGTATNAAAKTALAVGPSTTFAVHQGPLVSISAPSASTTVSGPVTYTITYTDATSVTLDEPDVTLNKTGTASGTVTVTGAGTTTRTVTISAIKGIGTLGISLAAATAVDGSSNTALAAGPSAAFSANNTAPAIGISAPSVTDTVNSPVTYTVSYTGVTNVTLAAKNITLNKTGTANGTVAVTGTGTTKRTVTISGITGHGTLGISIAAGTGTNLSLTPAPAAGPSATANIDLTVPFVVISAPSATLANTGPVTYTITYIGATAVTLANGNVTLNKTGTANGSVAVTGAGTATRTVTISSITGNGTLGISLAAATASNAASKTALAVGPSATFTVHQGPTISVSDPSVASTYWGPVTYTVTYADATSVTLSEADITLNSTGAADGTVTVTGAGTTTRTVTISNITGIGTLGISIAAGTAVDGSSNTAPAAGPSATFKTTNANPAILISAPSAASTITGPVTYTVNYSGVNSVTLSAASITLNTTGTATGTVAVSGTGTSTRTVTISAITGHGTLGISIADGSASNTTYQIPAPSAVSATFKVSLAVPFVMISEPSATTATTGPVTYTVTYLAATSVTLAQNNITLNKTGTANASVAVTGAGTATRTVTLSGITGTGTLGISIAAGTSTDAASHPDLGAGPSTVIYTNLTAPAVVISAPSATTATAGPVTYTVTYFGASDIFLGPTDITLNRTSTANGTVTVSSSGDTTRTVTISNITGAGTLGISIGAGTAVDASDNESLAAGPSTTFSVTNTKPAVVVSAPSGTTTKAGPVTYTVTYSGVTAVTLAAANVTLNKTGTANGTVAVTGAGTTTRTVTISGITGTGTLGISIAAGTGANGTLKTAAVAPSATFGVDNTPPTLSISDPSDVFTGVGPITYTVTYDGASAVTLASGDITLDATGTADGVVTVSGTGTDTRTVTISSITGIGTLGISIAAGTAADALGNQAPAELYSVTFDVYNSALSLAIGAPSAATTATGPITYTITYTGASAVTLANGDITLNKTGTADGTVAVTGAGTTTRTVTISSITGDGTLGISIASDTADDGAGELAPAAGPSTTFDVDNTAPTVAVSAPSAALTNSANVTYTITYTGATAVTLAQGNITLDKTGTADGTVAVAGAGATTRTVTISGITGDGTLGITIAAGTASDDAGNTALGSGPSATFDVDNTPPIVSISPPSLASTDTGPVTYTITFTGATSIVLDWIHLSGIRTGTADGTIAVSGTGTVTRTVTESDLTGNGTLCIVVGAGAATDDAGNASVEVTSDTFNVVN